VAHSPSSSTAARRYAEAVFEIAQRDGTVEQWLSQLDIAAASVSNAAVVRRLEDPSVPFHQRHEVFRGLFDGQMLDPLNNLMGIVLRRRMLQIVPGIAREYRRLYNRQAGIVEATATSAAQLEPDEVAALRERLEKMTSKKIELSLAVDPALLGGIQVRMGDLLLDGSVRGRLERLRERITSGTFTH
jgi:F-type H+-transporting ATPase subunit delta